MTKFQINGREVSVAADEDTPLLWVVRDELGLVGSKFGCGVAQCGACTMHVDGQPIRACVTPISNVAGRHVTTIEGINGNVAAAVRDAWVKLDVVQCGYCQSGQVMSAVALLNEIPAPSDTDIDNAMNGNICRCNTYQRIRTAIHDAAMTLKG